MTNAPKSSPCDHLLPTSPENPITAINEGNSELTDEELKSVAGGEGWIELSSFQWGVGRSN